MRVRWSREEWGKVLDAASPEALRRSFSSALLNAHRAVLPKDRWRPASSLSPRHLPEVAQAVFEKKRVAVGLIGPPQPALPLKPPADVPVPAQLGPGLGGASIGMLLGELVARIERLPRGPAESMAVLEQSVRRVEAQVARLEERLSGTEAAVQYALRRVGNSSEQSALPSLARRVRVTVVGLLPDQQRLLGERGLPAGLEVSYVDRERVAAGTPPACDVMVLMTKWCPHEAQEAAISQLGREKIRLVAGGLGDLTMMLRQLVF